MNEKLLAALDEVSDRYIVQAAKQKKHRRHLLLQTAAAVLLVVFLLNLPPVMAPVGARELVSPAEYEPLSYPDFDDYEDRSSWEAAYDAFQLDRERRSHRADSAVSSAGSFYEETFRVFLTGTENAAWSPVNAYMALGMLAQTASGSTRQELLELLGAESMESLREGIQAIWESVYLDDTYEQRLLANSIWLDKRLTYHQETLDLLGTGFYASVYRTNLDSGSAQRAIDAWIVNHTGGLLEPPAPKPLWESQDERVMTLISTVFLNARWSDPFQKSRNTEDLFHAPDGDVTCTYMNTKMQTMTYSWGEHYGAVALPTEEGSILWLILPDEGKTVDDVLASGDYLNTVLETSYSEDGRRGQYLVNLSLPKFDVHSAMDLRDGLEALGITEVFDREKADFSAVFADAQAYVDSIQQSARVTVDEQGIRAASVIRIEGAGAAMPPDEIVDFILDRPFLFVLTCKNVPLFAGTVTNP